MLCAEQVVVSLFQEVEELAVLVVELVNFLQAPGLATVSLS